MHLAAISSVSRKSPAKNPAIFPSCRKGMNCPDHFLRGEWRQKGSRAKQYEWKQKAYMIPVRGSLPPPPPPPPMVWSQNLRFAAFCMKTWCLQCFLHGGWLARCANLQIRRMSCNRPSENVLFAMFRLRHRGVVPFHPLLCQIIIYIYIILNLLIYSLVNRSDICLYLIPVKLSLRVTSFPYLNSLSFFSWNAPILCCLISTLSSHPTSCVAVCWRLDDPDPFPQGPPIPQGRAGYHCLSISWIYLTFASLSHLI